ncbi:MAG TPA: pilus assembly protein N-terminal domain-containing protein, partial [Tepidisphaeraceae bacterium]|nr:pilus assembly protein N-terminal domain-containing protein [Tepidisphaeraceae bacterium]
MLAQRYVKYLLPLALAMCLSSQPALAQDVAEAQKVAQIQLTTQHNAVITTTSDYHKISVADPAIADVNAIGPRSILVLGKKPGTTEVMVWDDSNRSIVYEVEVSPNLSELTKQLKLVLPNSAIEASDANGTTILRGRVASADEAKQAGEIAAAYTGAAKVLNYLQISGGQQVMLEVRFAEVARSALSQLGLNIVYADGVSSAASNIGQISPFGTGGGTGLSTGSLTSALSPAVTLFGGGEVGSTQIQAFLAALHQQNLARTLADPNLVTVSGQEASFL